MDARALTVKTVRDGPVCTLILSGDLDLPATGRFLEQAALAADERTERLGLDLAGVLFVDCAGVRALAIATLLCARRLPGHHPLAQPSRRIITVLGTDDVENFRRLTAGPGPRGGLRDGVASERELVPLTWGDLDLDA